MQIHFRFDLTNLNLPLLAGLVGLVILLTRPFLRRRIEAILRRYTFEKYKFKEIVTRMRRRIEAILRRYSGPTSLFQSTVRAPSLAPFLQRAVRIPVFGPFLRAILPNRLFGCEAPPIVEVIRYSALAEIVALVGFLVGVVLYALLEAVREIRTGGEADVHIHFLELFFHPVVLPLSVGLPILLFTVFHWRRRMKRSIKELGFAWERREAWRLLLGLAAALALIGGTLALSVAIGGLRVSVGGNPSASVWRIPVVLVFVALYEEVVFRGYLLQGLRLQKTTRWSILVTSFLFSLAHMQYLLLGWWLSLLAVLDLFAFAVLVAVARVVSGGLALPIGIHLGWNLLGWALGGMESDLFGQPSPWLRLDYSGASKLLVGTPGTGGLLDALLAVTVAGIVWRRFRDHPEMHAAPVWVEPASDR